MTPEEWVIVAKAREAQRRRGTFEGNFPRLESPRAAAAMGRYLDEVTRPGDLRAVAMAAVMQVENVLLDLQTHVKTMGDLRKLLTEVEKRAGQEAARVLSLRFEVSTLQGLLEDSRTTARRLAQGRTETAATQISRRRAEALLAHVAAGGPEGDNARLRLIEALCGGGA